MKRRVKLGKLSRCETGVYRTAILLRYGAAMTQTEDNADQAHGKPTLIAITLAMVMIGAIMLLQGFGLYDAAWFRPNPKTPQWVFGLVGAILILAAILMAGKVTTIPARIVNMAGYSILGLSWIMAHWLILFSEGGSCGAETGSMLLNLPALACRGTMGAVLIGFDLILLAILSATLRPSRRA